MSSPLRVLTLASILGLAAFATVAEAQTTRAARRPTTNPPTRPAELTLPLDAQRILGVVANDDEDLLEAWQFAVEDRQAEDGVTRRGAALENLVAAALAGGRADALANVVLARMTLGDEVGDPTDPHWPFGSPTDRVEIVRAIARIAAQSAREGHADEAARWTRASVLLSAQLGFRYGPYEFVATARQARRDAKAAGLNALEVEALTRQHRALLTATDRFDAAYAAAVFEIDEALIVPANIEPAVAALTEARAAADASRLAHVYDVALLARTLRDLIHAQGDDAAKARIDATITRWRDAFRSEHARRWFGQALGPPSPPRTTPLASDLPPIDPRNRLLRR